MAKSSAIYRVHALHACVAGVIELDSKFDQHSVPSLSRTEEMALFSEIAFSSPVTNKSPASNQMKLESNDHDTVVIHYLEQFSVAFGLCFCGDSYLLSLC